MAKRLDNIAFVKSIMERSDFGAMAQLFILDAIQKQADKISAAGIESVRAAFGEHALISPDAWHGVAVELQRKFKERV